jgi:hypothetical protein
MAKKQQDGLPGLDDQRWLPLGDNAATARVLAIKGLRIACRERGDHRELAPLDPGLSLEALCPGGQSKYFYYIWEPDQNRLYSLLTDEEERFWRRVAETEQQNKEVVGRRKPGPKPTADWKTRVAYYVGCIKGSGEELPTAAELAQWCGTNLGYTPDVSEINKLLRTLLD